FGLKRENRKMIKTYSWKFLIISYLMLGNFCWQLLLAEENNVELFNSPVTSPDSMEQFKKIAEKLKEHKIIRAVFKQTKVIKALKRPLLSEGLFLIATEKGLYFETTKP